VLVYPADATGCGHHRLIWPTEELRRQGHDVAIVRPSERHLRLVVNDETGTVVDVVLPRDVDVVVLQRVTHRYLVQAITALRAKGVAVVVDVDDDLTAVHPSNPAWRALHPRGERATRDHTWANLTEACRAATLVTVTTPALLRRYAGHGRGRVLYNYLASHYCDVAHVDSDLVGWPAALASHPNDPSVVGSAIARLVAEGVRFAVTSEHPGVATAFGLADDRSIEYVGSIDLPDWPSALTRLGVGIAPLADTRFNAAKSWLKPLELAAVGVPWVASPRVEYRRLHDLGCGVLVDKPKLWYRALRRLVDEPARRAELGLAGREVAASLRLSDHAWRWWEAWSDALTLQRNAPRASTVVS
jgi:hypothetical protein